MARIFVYQYNGDSATRDYETVSDGIPPPTVGDRIWRKVGSVNLEWVVENVTPIHTTIAATADHAEEYRTEYIIDLGAA
jgi:hypothetical protein